MSGELKRTETETSMTIKPSEEARSRTVTSLTRPFNLFWTNKAPSWPPTKSNSKVCFEEMPVVSEEHSSTKIPRRQSLRIDETDDCLDGVSLEEVKVGGQEECAETAVVLDFDTLAISNTGVLGSCLVAEEESQTEEIDEAPDDHVKPLEKSEKLHNHEGSLRGAIEAVKVASLYARIVKEAETFRRMT